MPRDGSTGPASSLNCKTTCCPLDIGRSEAYLDANNLLLAHRELRLELNPSQKDVWDLTYPAFFPSPPEALKMKDETAWYFYLAEIALMRLKNRILRCLYRSDAAPSPESRMEYAILDFEEQIEVWSVSALA